MIGCLQLFFLVIMNWIKKHKNAEGKTNIRNCPKKDRTSFLPPQYLKQKAVKTSQNVQMSEVLECSKNQDGDQMSDGSVVWVWNCLFVFSMFKESRWSQVVV